MKDSTRRKTLLSLGLLMVVMVLIAANLSQLELKPGMPPPGLERSQGAIVAVEQDSPVVFPLNKFFAVFFGLLLAGSMVYVIYKLIKGAEWKLVLRVIPSVLAIGLGVMIFMFFIMLLPKSVETLPMDMPLPTPAPRATSPLGPVPPLLIWMVAIGLLVLTILVGFWAFFSSSRQTSPMDMVGLEAEKAWQALKTGLDLKDVIVRCYRQMSLALEKEGEIEREDFMTTREFEKLLAAAGAPQAPIHQLTLLFEAVRYGNWQPNPVDEQKAIDCLEAIMLYSHDAKRTK